MSVSAFSNEDLNRQLFEAVNNNNLNEVQKLLKAGADPDLPDRWGGFVLIEACKVNNMEMVKTVLKYTNKVNIFDKHVLILIDFKKVPVQSSLKGGLTPLSVAVLNKNTKLITYLLSKGADINFKNKNGSTAIFQAAGESSLPVLQFLVKNKAQINIINNDGQTPLSFALLKHEVENADYLLEKKAKINLSNKYIPIILVCEAGSLELLKKIVDRGGDVNALGLNGDSPLYWAFSSDNVEMIDYLIKKGANPDGPKGSSLPPLIIPAFKGNIKLIKFLINKGANINKKDKDGQTVLHYVCLRQNSNLEVIKLLIDNSADINAVDNNNVTPLYYLCLDCNIEGINLLLNLGADPSIKSKNGYTPIMVLPKDCGDLELRKRLTAKR